MTRACAGIRGARSSARLVASWDARASVDSVGYRLVRAFHERTQQAVWDMVLQGLGMPADEEHDPPSQFEGPLWQLVTSQPLHMLASNYADWPQFLRAQLDATIADLGDTLSCSWSTAPGDSAARCASGTRSPARCPDCPDSSTCRRLSCPAMKTCRAFRRARSAPRSDSPYPPATRTRHTSRCRAARAAIRCRPITVQAFSAGRAASRCRCCPGLPEHTLILTPN